ncbi:MAG TPA: hypothetical protein VIE43_19775 [Thermoanaerobaculia bacterium]|nr:hypothetical protein [Thermoanaerobaculia bacterium]
MDFARVYRVVSAFLNERESPYAVIGGVALVAYGLPRTTLDLDFIVEAAIQDDLIRFLESHGYETLHRSSGYSNHQHPDPLWGNLDFVYVSGGTSQELFGACTARTGPGGVQIPVPTPEHLAAMKVMAMKNDPSRELQDMADIRFLLSLPGVDPIQIRDYFDRQGMRDRYDDVKKT